MPDTATIDVTPAATEIQQTVTSAAVQTALTPEDEAAFEAAVAADDATKAGKAPLSPAKAAATTQPDIPPSQPPTTPAVPTKAAGQAGAKVEIEDIPEAAIDPKTAKKATATTTEPDAAAAQAAREKEIAEQTKGMSVKAADRFRAIEKAKWEAEQQARKVPELEKKLVELEKAQKALAEAKGEKDVSETERLRKQVDELDAVVQKQALADHPKFRAHYDEKIEKEITRAKGLAGEAHAAEVAQLLNLPESKQRDARLTEILAELEPIAEGKLKRAIDEVDRLTSERSSELSNWKQNKLILQELSAKAQAEAEAARKGSRETAYQSMMATMADPDKGIELFRPVDGNDEWNAKVKARAEAVKKIVDSDLAPTDIAEIATMAVAAKDYRTLFHVQRAAIKKLQDQIADMSGAQPTLGGDGAATPPREDNASMTDAVIDGLVKAGHLK